MKLISRGLLILAMSFGACDILLLREENKTLTRLNDKLIGQLVVEMEICEEKFPKPNNEPIDAKYDIK